MDKKTILQYLPLETERLIIRPLAPNDLDAIQTAKVEQEETLRRWMCWSNDFGISRAGLDDHFKKSSVDENIIPLMGFDKQTGHFVIASGIDNAGQNYNTINTGWWLAKGYEGQGLAFEAMHKIYDFLQHIIGAKCVQAQFYNGNTRSHNLMERLGMHYVETVPKSHTSHLTGEQLDVIKYERIFE